MSRPGIKCKPRKCAIPEEWLKQMGEKMKERFFGYNEISEMLKESGYKCEPYQLISYLEARNYLIATEEHKTRYGIKVSYRVMTAEVYKKIEEEHRENVARRLLAAVSC